MMLLDGILHQNTFKFPRVKRWEGKLNFKNSKTVTASEVLLAYVHSTNAMHSWICIGRYRKYFLNKDVHFNSSETSEAENTRYR